MTRDEAQAVIAHYDQKASDWSKHSTAADRVAVHAYQDAAARLREALEKSEAANRECAARPLRVGLRVPRLIAIERGITFGSSWGATPQEMPEAGPGLWRAMGLHQDRGDMILTIEQVTP